MSLLAQKVTLPHHLRCAFEPFQFQSLLQQLGFPLNVTTQDGRSAISRRWAYMLGEIKENLIDGAIWVSLWQKIEDVTN